MKKITLSIAVLFIGLQSHALTLQDIVLGVDMTDFELTTIFPCSAHQTVMFCNDNLILEKGCADTLKVSHTNGQISCKAISGSEVVFGQVDPSSFFKDLTNGGTGGYHVQFTPNVSLETKKTPNGQTEYQLIVH